MKKCLRCGECKSVDDFTRRTSSPDGRYSYCKVCQREEKRRYRLSNPEAVKASAKAWKEKNLEKASNDVRLRRDQRPHADQVYSANSRAKRLGIDGKITVSEWEDVLFLACGKCLACRKEVPLTIDHVRPFAVGGLNIVDNVQPLCIECNRKKGVKIEDYRQSPLG